MDNRVKRILVLGGGTAGWMTACFLNRTLRSTDGQSVEITLVESRDIGIVGVSRADALGVAPCRLVDLPVGSFRNLDGARATGAGERGRPPLERPVRESGFLERAQ